MDTSSPLKTLRATYQLSQDGITALKNKLLSLQNDYVQTRERLRAFKDQISALDSDENLTLVENVNTMQRLEIEIKKLKDILASARPFSNRHTAQSQVELGSRVHLLSGDQQVTYTIVTSLEADPSAGKISDQSPLGKALLGRSVQESIAFQPKASARPYNLTLLGIE